MNLDHLACFIEVASQRSFTKAADRLYLSQSTVSRRVGHLEEELGCRLIERNALDFELTREGETVLALGSAVLEQVARLQNSRRPARSSSASTACSSTSTWQRSCAAAWEQAIRRCTWTSAADCCANWRATSRKTASTSPSPPTASCPAATA